MFEVLLQADRALASGALDQAERSYWQLVELDPTNAIAVAGLARVSLERGDRHSARTFAERALAMDPELLAARKLIEGLDGHGVAPLAPNATDAAMLAAAQLESFGKRRAAAGDSPAGGPGRAALPDGGPQLPSEPLPDRRRAGRKAAAAAAAAAEAAPRPSLPSRSGEGPRAGHQALGDRARRLMTPEVKPAPRSQDPFWAAESAAAVEAVDSLDDEAVASPAAEPGESGGGLGAAGAADEEDTIAMRIALLSGVPGMDAASLEAAEFGAAGFASLEGAEAGEPASIDEDASFAMRIALVSDAAQLEAAELEAAAHSRPSPAHQNEPPGDAAFGEAEAAAAPLHAVRPRHHEMTDQERLELERAAARIEFEATEAELAAAEAASAEMAEIDLAAAEIEFAATEAELAAAEAESVEIATAETVAQRLSHATFEAAESGSSDRPNEHPVKPAVPGASSRRTVGEPSEEDAEAAALREALTLVLDNESAASAAPQTTAPAVPAPEPEPASEPEPSPPAAPNSGHEGSAPSESILEDDQKSAREPRRKGLFHRLRGE